MSSSYNTSPKPASPLPRTKTDGRVEDKLVRGWVPHEIGSVCFTLRQRWDALESILLAVANRIKAKGWTIRLSKHCHHCHSVCVVGAAQTETIGWTNEPGSVLCLWTFQMDCRPFEYHIRCLTDCPSLLSLDYEHLKATATTIIVNCRRKTYFTIHRVRRRWM